MGCALAALALTLVGCPEDDEPAEEAPAPVEATADTEREAAEEAALQRAEGAAMTLGRTLKQRLTEAMAEGGPPRAVSVCADEAQVLTAQAGEQHQASVGRSSKRLRNPDNQGPDWVHDWLREQGDRPAAEARPLTKVVGDRARVVRPIAMEGMCLTCHGPPEGIAPEVRAVLRERYPEDQATGYREGDLRGALWAQTRVTGED